MLACACFNMRTQARIMLTYTNDLHMQAYVCARIFVLRNPNSNFSVPVSMFLPHDMLPFDPFLCFLSLCSLVYDLLTFNMLD